MSVDLVSDVYPLIISFEYEIPNLVNLSYVCKQFNKIIKTTRKEMLEIRKQQHHIYSTIFSFVDDFDTLFNLSHVCEEFNWIIKTRYKSVIESRKQMNPITWASSNGKIHVLEWWKRHYQINHENLECTESDIVFASSHGHENVLEWWKNYYESINKSYNNIYKPIKHNILVCSEWAITLAVKNGHIHILEWWANYYRETNRTLKFPENLIYQIYENQQFEVLEWVSNNVLI